MTGPLASPRDNPALISQANRLLSPAKSRKYPTRLACGYVIPDEQRDYSFENLAWKRAFGRVGEYCSCKVCISSRKRNVRPSTRTNLVRASTVVWAAGCCKSTRGKRMGEFE